MGLWRSSPNSSGVDGGWRFFFLTYTSFIFLMKLPHICVRIGAQWLDDNVACMDVCTCHSWHGFHTWPPYKSLVLSTLVIILCAVLVRKVYLSAQKLHVEQQCQTRGRSAQDPPCPRAHVRSKKKKKKSGIWLSRFRQNFPWEASPEALLEVISDENIGRTDKLSRSS